MSRTRLVRDAVAILRTDEWTEHGGGSLHDAYGNRVVLWQANEDEVRVEFEYAIPGIVETLTLAAGNSPQRIARIIDALARPDV